MKQTILIFQLAIALLFNTATFAQEPKPSSVPYWVVESNVNTPRHSVVYFYSTGHQVMYKEMIEKKRLNVNREKIRRQLNEVLKQVTMAWEKDKQLKADELLVSRIFRSK